MRRKKSRPRRPRSTPRQTPVEAYSSPAERKRIIERRDKLLKELIFALVANPGDQREIDKLVQQYGAQEVHLVLDAFQKKAQHAELIGNETALYRQYRHTLARFGGDRPFFTRQEYGGLSFQHGMLLAKREFKSPIPRKPGARERELRDLLLTDAAFWDDITPPAPPPRPADFAAPSPGTFVYPAQTLLKWGWNLGDERAKDNARNTSKWRLAAADLARMALDEGLLNGWPGEPASWAPYHALEMLGHLCAHQVAGQLCALFEQENDWLSDRLAVTWGRMGPQAEPPLWDYLNDGEHSSDARSVVMLGLANIAQANPARRGDVVTGLTDLLRRAATADARANAYIVHVLDRLEAVEARKVIFAAFEQGKIEERIISPGSLRILASRA